MKRFSALFIFLIISVLVVITKSEDFDPHYLEADSSYLIAVPNKVYPDQVVQVYVTLFQLKTPLVSIRVAIRRNNEYNKPEDICSVTEVFTYPTSKLLQMIVPSNSPDGNYTVNVEGSSTTGVSAGYLFRNETEIKFMRKEVSVFIQLNKPMYRQGQEVKFRIISVKPNLLAKSSRIDIDIFDATGTNVRHWVNLQTNAGEVLELTQQLSDQPSYGEWTIRVWTFGRYYYRNFTVNEFWVTAIDVNVSMPMAISENDFGIAGIIMANLSLGQPVKGTIRIELEVEPPKDRIAALEYVKAHRMHINDEMGKSSLNNDDDLKNEPNINVFNTEKRKIIRELRYFPGLTDFMFSMDEIRELIGQSPANHELVVTAYVYDWFLVQHASGSSRAVVYSNATSIHLLGDKSRTFKPGMPISIYFAVSNQDGTPLRSNRRQITVRKVEHSQTGSKIQDEKMLVRDDGIIKYMFTPGENTMRIRITAYYDLYQSNAVEVYMQRHYTKFNRYLYISSSTESPKVGTYMVFTIRSNTVLETVHYLITAASNIVAGGVMDMYSSQKTFSIAVSRDMIPEARMVVWSIYKSEVLVDSLNFFVNGTRLNYVDMRVNKGKDFTGDTVELTGWSDPSSFMAFSGLGYELYAYSGGMNFMQEIDIVNELSTFDSHANKSFRFEWIYDETFRELVNFPAPTYAIDANKTFEFAGLLVFTDANVTRLPHTCNETLGSYPCNDGLKCFTIDRWCNGEMDCDDGVDEMGCTNTVKKYPFTKPFDRLSLLTRHYMETGDWLWKSHFLMPNGRIDLPTDVPDEPMSWTVDAFSISKEKGFGMIFNRPRHQATRPFYMRAEAPASIIKGEQVGVRISLFNYWVENLETLVTLHASDDYAFVVVEKDGIVSSYSPRLIRGDIQTMVYMEANAVREMHFPVLHLKDGCFTVTLSVASIMYKDTTTVTMCSTYDGVTNFLHIPFFIDLINKGSRVIPDLEIPVPERFIKPQERQHLYVPGSPIAKIGISGDVVGPGFFQDYLEAENTLRRPYGSAENCIFNLATNVFYAWYMSETSQLRNERLKKAILGMNEGLQRLYSYYTVYEENGIEYGYFSQFRDYQKPTPSVWLSAHAYKILHKIWTAGYLRIGIERVNVEMSTLVQLSRWLCLAKNVDMDGIWKETSPKYNRKMWKNGTISNEYDNVALTAHVMSALFFKVGNSWQQCEEPINRAKQFLNEQSNKDHPPFTTAILSYTLMLNGETNPSAFHKLRKMKLEGKYWANKKIPANEIRYEDNLPVHQSRRFYDNEAYGVATTSYALLAHLFRQSGYEEMFPTMSWLQSMRNSFAGFASTEDSMLALWGLVEYALKDMNRAFYQMYLEVTPTSNMNKTYVLRLNKTNWVDFVEIPIDPVWGYVRGMAMGNGIALMQLTSQVNVEYSRQILPKPEGDFFNIHLSERYYGKNNSIIHLTPCVKWLRNDLSNASGLTVLEMDIPTGYVITNDVLRAYAQSGNVSTLRRAESYGRKVVFYFDYVKYAENTCVDFRIDRWFPVANMTIQHKIRVYDYYEPGMHNTSLYTTHYLTSLHICQVCGSFQCPYCPFYNQAPMQYLSSILLFFTSIILLITFNRFGIY